MSLIQKLRAGPIDIVGDIHGEYQALMMLLHHLGYDSFGRHPDERYLVFVGDFCDRGPDSPAVLSLIRKFVNSGNAMAVLGNHEINLLCGEAKDGSGWYFEERFDSDLKKYSPFTVIRAEDKQELTEFLNSLPIALIRDDIRVIHAAWMDEYIKEVEKIPLGQAVNFFKKCEIFSQIQSEKYLTAMDKEASEWPHSLEICAFQPPNFPAHAEYAAILQMNNPIKVLTAGVEKPGRSPFYSSGKWRFAERVQWWDYYYDDVPVVIGHYWRKFYPALAPQASNRDPNLFQGSAPAAWHGARKNVFCVDYSIGGKFTSRINGDVDKDVFRLAALRWPERTLHFDNGDIVTTTNFSLYN